MKVLQILIGLIVAAFIIFTIAVGFSINSAEDIIKKSVESISSELTQSELKVKESDFDLNQGGGLLKGVTLNNPKGFSDSTLMNIGEMLVTLDVNSAKNPVKVIKQLEVNNIVLLHEINNQGLSNLEVIFETIANKSSDKKNVYLMIETLVVGEVEITLNQNNQTSTTTLAAYTESNIGSTDAGLTSEQLARALFDSLLTRALN